jgi:hypothetical protein
MGVSNFYSSTIQIFDKSFAQEYVQNFSCLERLEQKYKEFSNSSQCSEVLKDEIFRLKALLSKSLFDEKAAPTWSELAKLAGFTGLIADYRIMDRELFNHLQMGGVSCASYLSIRDDCQVFCEGMKEKLCWVIHIFHKDPIDKEKQKLPSNKHSFMNAMLGSKSLMFSDSIKEFHDNRTSLKVLISCDLENFEVFILEDEEI